MFRFTIRDVLWLTVIVAMGLCLYLQWERAKKWESRAEYVRTYFHARFGVESIWTGNDSGVDLVDDDPHPPSNR